MLYIYKSNIQVRLYDGLIPKPLSKSANRKLFLLIYIIHARSIRYLLWVWQVFDIIYWLYWQGQEILLKNNHFTETNRIKEPPVVEGIFISIVFFLKTRRSSKLNRSKVINLHLSWHLDIIVWKQAKKLSVLYFCTSLRIKVHVFD